MIEASRFVSVVLLINSINLLYTVDGLDFHLECNLQMRLPAAQLSFGGRFNAELHHRVRPEMEWEWDIFGINLDSTGMAGRGLIINSHDVLFG